MTTPTTNYGWPKPNPTEYAAVTGINALTDAMDASFKTVLDGMGATIKPMIQMKLNASYSPGNMTVQYIASSNGWEEVFNVKGTIPSSNASPVVLMTTDGYISFNAPGIYRLTSTINVGTYTSAVEGFWMTGLFTSPGHIIVPRTKHTERMQTYTFGQGIHHSVLLKADTSGSPDVVVGDGYVMGMMHDVNTASVFISCKPSDLDPFFSYVTIEYVRGL